MSLPPDLELIFLKYVALRFGTGKRTLTSLMGNYIESGGQGCTEWNPVSLWKSCVPCALQETNSTGREPKSSPLSPIVLTSSFPLITQKIEYWDNLQVQSCFYPMTRFLDHLLGIMCVFQNLLCEKGKQERVGTGERELRKPGMWKYSISHDRASN